MENTQHTVMLKKIKEILIMSSYLALLSTLNGSNYPRLELNSMVPKVFEPLKFDCSSLSYTLKQFQTKHLKGFRYCMFLYHVFFFFFFFLLNFYQQHFDLVPKL